MSAESIVGLISGGTGGMTVLVIWLSLFLADKMHTDAEMKREQELRRLETEARERAEESLERERLAHSETRRALADAAARGDAAVRAAEVVASAMSAGQRSTRVVP